MPQACSQLKIWELSIPAYPLLPSLRPLPFLETGPLTGFRGPVSREKGRGQLGVWRSAVSSPAKSGAQPQPKLKTTHCDYDSHSVLFSTLFSCIFGMISKIDTT